MLGISRRTRRTTRRPHPWQVHPWWSASSGSARRVLPDGDRSELQPGDVLEVPWIRRQQLEITLNRLRCEPEVIDSKARIASGLLQASRQGPEHLCRLDRDPKLRLTTHPAHCRGRPLLSLPARSISTPNCISAMLTGDRYTGSCRVIA